MTTLKLEEKADNPRDKRLENIDVAKGIGILLMIAGHIFDNEVFGVLVYGFHMPLFCIITGILKAQKEQLQSFLPFVKRRFCSLIVPYIVVEIIVLPLFYLKYHYTFKDWRWIILESVLLYSNRGGATWYLLNLFLSELEFFLILKNKDRTFCAIIACILFVIGTTIISDNHIIFIILRSFVAVGFIALGYLHAPVFLRKPFSQWFFTLPVVYAFFAIKNGRVDMCGGSYQNQVIYFLCSVIGSYSIMVISNWIASHTVTVKRTLAFWGANSMIVLCTHLILMRFFIDTQFEIGPRYGFKVGCAVFVFVLCFEYALISCVGYCKKKL